MSLRVYKYVYATWRSIRRTIEHAVGSAMYHQNTPSQCHVLRKYFLVYNTCNSMKLKRYKIKTSGLVKAYVKCILSVTDLWGDRNEVLNYSGVSGHLAVLRGKKD